MLNGGFYTKIFETKEELISYMVYISSKRIEFIEV